MKKKIYILAIILFLIDFLVKKIINIYDVNLTIINNFFYIDKTYNTGAAWSILENKIFFLILITIIFIIIIMKYIDNFILNKRNIIAFSLLGGGILGNLFDRIFYGYVIDYISFKFGTYYFPVFNIADTFIISGVFLLIIAIIRKEDLNGNHSK